MFIAKNVFCFPGMTGALRPWKSWEAYKNLKDRFGSRTACTIKNADGSVNIETTINQIDQLLLELPELQEYAICVCD